jgi:branched-chain amino acid transport system ATP-binding protein
MLRVDNLAKSFGGVQALRGASLAVAAGELVALIGPNGAGKSTCFNCINGQLRPETGTVHLDNADITGLDPRRIWAHGVGRTFQIAVAFASMTALENVQTALLAARGRTLDAWSRAGGFARDQALHLLAEVGLRDMADRSASLLAYGDVKRLELALALAHRPRLLLMDEPTAGMARAERRAMMDLVHGLARRDGLAVLFTEHDMEAVFGHADRIVVLDRGQVIATGTPDAIRADAQVRAVYLGEEVP